MIAKVFSVNQDTGEFHFEHFSDTRDFEDQIDVETELQKCGRCWIGGGAAQLFYVQVTQ